MEQRATQRGHLLYQCMFNVRMVSLHFSLCICPTMWHLITAQGGRNKKLFHNIHHVLILLKMYFWRRLYESWRWVTKAHFQVSLGCGPVEGFQSIYPWKKIEILMLKDAMTGCSGAVPHNLLTFASSAWSGFLPHKQKTWAT